MGIPLTAEEYKRLFVHTESRYAIQKGDGQYQAFNRPISLQDIKDHLEGKATFGFYQLKEDPPGKWTVKWAVVDIDINKTEWNKPTFNIDDWKEILDKQVEEVQNVLNKFNLPHYVEWSGFKGYHVWVFFEKPMDARVVKNSLENMFEKVDPVHEGLHLELFPKQDRADSGNLVKGPYAIHQKTQQKSYFTDPTFCFKNIKFANYRQVLNSANPLEAVVKNCAAIRNLKEKVEASNHLTDQERVALMLTFAGLEGGSVFLEKEFLSKCSDYDPKKVKYHVDRALKKQYKPILCTTLQDRRFEKICPHQCSIIGKSKSPIAFYYRTRGDDEPIGASDSSPLMDLYSADNCYYLRGKDGSGDIPLSTFVYDVHEDLEIDDGIKKYRMFKGIIHKRDGSSFPFDIDPVHFSTESKFKEALYTAGGLGNLTFTAFKPLAIAIETFSNPRKLEISKNFGYNTELTAYYTPSYVVSVDGIEKNTEIKIDLTGEDKAEQLDFTVLSDDEFDDISDHIRDTLLTVPEDPFIAHATFAHAMLPVIGAFVTQDDKTRFIYYLQGTTGKGKSWLLNKMMMFYGNFKNVPSWLSTPYSLQKMGHRFKDAFFHVDDFKKANFSKGDWAKALAILQGYADDSGRSRLKSDSTFQESYYIRGYLAVTAEHDIEGEASNLARMITIRYKSKNETDLEKGEICNRLQHKYSGFTPRYIQWVLRQDPAIFQKTMSKYAANFNKTISGQPNSVRIARNFAMLMTSYYYVATFLWKDPEKLIEDFHKQLEVELLANLQGATEELASNIFWETLQEMLASDRLKIQASQSVSDETKKNVTSVGFHHAGETYLVVNLAYSEVTRYLQLVGRPFGHSKKAIYNELFQEGKILDRDTEPKKMNGKVVRVVRVNFDED